MTEDEINRIEQDITTLEESIRASEQALDQYFVDNNWTKFEHYCGYIYVHPNYAEKWRSEEFPKISDYPKWAVRKPFY